MSKSYVAECLSGNALLEDVDDWVDAWHEGRGPGTLFEHLGMTEQEYSLWVEQPESLRFIIYSRDSGTPIEALLRTAERGIVSGSPS